MIIAKLFNKYKINQEVYANTIQNLDKSITMQMTDADKCVSMSVSKSLQALGSAQ